MSAGKFYESDYEKAFISYLEQTKWEHTEGERIARPISDPLIETDLDSFLRVTYPNLTPTEIKSCIAHLRNSSGQTEYLTARATISLYRNGFNLVREDPSAPMIHIDFIDFETPSYNVLRVVNQFTMVEGGHERRPDVLLFINGIPVCIIELKNPVNAEANIYSAWEQIYYRYRRDIPSLTRFCALAVISDGACSHLGTPFTPYEHFYAWKKVENTDDPAGCTEQMRTLIQGALSPTRLLEILHDYIYFPDVAAGVNNSTEIVCRYPQFFATRMLFKNILKHAKINADADGRGGTYFGATGCGKTYTMLFLARQLALRARKSLGSPTILIIVDREDLQTQSGSLFCCSKDFLEDQNVREIDSRADLQRELGSRSSGGIFIMTIQKLTADIGFLNDRANIICLSDEAHRTQLGTGEKVVVDAQKGVYETYGFAHYLREAFPKATFVGFTGTPIDETIHVFGEIVDRYSMKQAVRDGITVDIKYEARLARVKMDQEQAQKIEAFYKECEQEGADPAQIERSKNAMSSMEVILGDDGRLEKVANDIVQHYEQFTENRQGMVNKAMIVCANRQIAFKLYKKLVSVRPTWAEGDIPKLNFVATRGQNDPQELYELCGDRAHHKNLDIEFKKPESPFHIVIVVDMWITGFDVPNLTLLYNDKPLRRHSLIQTISRVNRKYEGKEFGLVVDYLGIRENMLKALKQYGGDGEGGSGTTIEQVEDVYETFKKILVELNELFEDFDMSPYFEKNSIVRYECLNRAVEFVLSQVTEQTEKEKKDRVPTFKTIFIQTVKRLKSAYDICQPAGKLNSHESALANFYMGVSNILSKYTSNGKDVAQMNKIVEEMVKKAIECTGVETILNAEGAEDLFGEGIWAEIHEIKAPNTKFQLLVKMMKRAIKEYSKVNKAKAQQFEQMLQEVIEEYNTRDRLIFTNSVAQDTVNAVQNVVEEKVQTYIDRIQDLFAKLKTDREEFKNMGITFEQKAFYDILVEVRNRYQFEYEDERCKELSIKISELIENSSIYANWLHNANIRSQLSFNLVALLYQEGYPPEWSNEIFEKVLDQVENFKKYN